MKNLVSLLPAPRLIHTAESFSAALIPPSAGPHLPPSISSEGKTEGGGPTGRSIAWLMAKQTPSSSGLSGDSGAKTLEPLRSIGLLMLHPGHTQSASGQGWLIREGGNKRKDGWGLVTRTCVSANSSSEKLMRLLPHRSSLDAPADCTACRGGRVVPGLSPHARTQLGYMTVIWRKGSSPDRHNCCRKKKKKSVKNCSC